MYGIQTLHYKGEINVQHWQRFGTYIAITAIAFATGFLAGTVPVVPIPAIIGLILVLSIFFTCDGKKW